MLQTSRQSPVHRNVAFGSKAPKSDFRFSGLKTDIRPCRFRAQTQTSTGDCGLFARVLRTRGTDVISRLGQVDESDLHFFGVAEGQRWKGARQCRIVPSTPSPWSWIGSTFVESED